MNFNIWEIELRVVKNNVNKQFQFPTNKSNNN